MKKKLTSVVTMLLAATLALTGCGGASGTKAEGKVARLVSGGEPGSLHPATSQGTHESIILDHIFEGLMKRDNEGKIVPGMAKDYTISDDKLVYTFTLRDDAAWSNGEPVTAQDFEFSWKYALNPNTASDYAYQLYYLKGGEEYNSFDIDSFIAMQELEKQGSTKEEAEKKLSDLKAETANNQAAGKEEDPYADFIAAQRAAVGEDKVAQIEEEQLSTLEAAVGVKAVDDKTLEVTLNNPTPYFLELCGFYTYYPVSKAVQEENPEWAANGDTFVSNGPFVVTEWNHDQSVVVVKNDHYYNKDEVKLDGIEFIISEDLNTNWQMYQKGETDANIQLPTDVLGQLRAEKNPELNTVTELSTYFYRFNTTRKPFNNVKVRKALTMVIDRKTLVEKVAQGGQIPAYAYIPSGIPDATGDFRENGGNFYEDNVEAAKKLLAEGLKEEGVDKLSFSILYNTDEMHKKIAEAIQQMWSEIGADVTLENTEFRVKIDREHALDFEVSRAGWIGDYVDPNTFLDMFTSWSTQNDTGWTRPEYDAAIRNASKEFDAAKRMEYLHEAENMLMNDLPIMPLFYYTKSTMIKPHLVGTYKAPNRELNLIYADIVEDQE